MSNTTDRLVLIQSTLKAPKGQYNSFGKYHYRSAEDILEAVKPLLAENGLSMTISDTLENIGTRYYVKATATLTDGEDSVSVSAYAREEETKKGMDGSQITGAASSYARKYALNGLFLIDDTKDADAQAPETVSKAPKQATPKTPKQHDHLEPIRALIKDYCAKLGIDTKQGTQNILDYMGCESMKQIAPDGVETVLQFMADQMNEVG